MKEAGYTVVKSICLGFKLSVFWILALRTSASYGTCLSLRFLIYKMGIMGIN